MKITSAEFVASYTSYTQCPKGDLPEYAFIGRSNVGKSSLINMLTGKSKLAKTSAKPGKTQLINFFLINERWHLVDLPGYGWAQVSKSARKSWRGMIEAYLLHREPLTALFILIDARLPPQKNDMAFVQWAGEHQIPFSLIFTKADKQSAAKTEQSVEAFRQEMLRTWEDLPPMFVSSAVDKTGQEEILQYIDSINQDNLM